MEFEVNGQTYRADKLSAMDQFHIMRRLAPMLSSLQGLSNNGMDAIGPLAETVAKMSDADANYVIFGLLKSVSKKQSNGLGWAKVSAGERLMYDNLTMPEVLQLVWHSLQNNLGDFFNAAPSALTSEIQKQKSQ